MRNSRLRILQLIRVDARVREQLVDRYALRSQFGRERGQAKKTLRRRIEIRMQRGDDFRWTHDMSRSSCEQCSHISPNFVEQLAHFDAAIGRVERCRPIVSLR